MPQTWLDKLRTLLSEIRTSPPPSWQDEDGRTSWRRPALWPGLTSREPALMEAEEEVAADQRGRLLLASRTAGLCADLLARLRQQPPPALDELICREGIFTLVTLSDLVPPPSPEPLSAQPDEDGSVGAASARNWRQTGAWTAAAYDVEPWQEAAAAADLVVYLFAGEWSAEDARWSTRLRAQGVPFLPVLMPPSPSHAADPADNDAAEAFEHTATRVRQATGIRPVAITGVAGVAEAAPPDLLDLLNRILALRPRLSILLAQEIPYARPLIAARIVRTGALMATLIGSEPIPLLDLPLHVAVQWKMALQLGAIYGRPGLDYRSREMLGTVFVNLCARQLAQQAIKIVPVIGWLLSGAISGGSAWLFGRALCRYYEQDRVFTWPSPFGQWPNRFANLAHHFAPHKASAQDLAQNDADNTDQTTGRHEPSQ